MSKKIKQISTYNNGTWMTPVDFGAEADDIKIGNKSVKEIIGNYLDSKTITEKLVEMRGATSLTSGEEGLVPAPQIGDENKILKGDGTWGYTNFLGTINQWNRLSLDEKKSYDTVDIVNAIQVTYISNNGSSDIYMDEAIVNESYIIKEVDFTAPESKEFKEWNTEIDGTGISYDINDVIFIEDELILYAIWQYATCTVTYNANGGSGTMSSDSILAGSDYVVRGNAFTPPVNKLFKIWNTEPDGTGVSYKFDDDFILNNDITLYAIWDLAALKFSSNAQFSLSVRNKYWDGIIEYTIDDGNSWVIWDGSTIAGTISQSIYLRGTGNTIITGYNSSAEWSFTGKYITGNIELLLDYQEVINERHPVMGDYCYQDMFYGCGILEQPPELPAIQLTSHCYDGMFERCTSLTIAPELPAITLTNYCYSGMFSGCTSLMQAPNLPATTLADDCYSSMFDSCTSLTTAPELPATALAERCYFDMFHGCTRLTIAPELPATTLANDCYSGMFSNCSNLITPPTLPVMALTARCYYKMFENCISLVISPELPAITLANYCYSEMFKGCTSLIITPELPATVIASGCYNSMFEGCTSLEILPELYSTSLLDLCYRGMFENCTKIKLSETQTDEYQYEYRIPVVGTGIEEYSGSSLDNMFANTGGTFTGTPNINTVYYTNRKKDDTITALKFSSDNNFTLNVDNPNWDGIVEYSINKGNSWSVWDGSQLSGSFSQPIYLRGTGNTVITGGTNHEWTFTGKYCVGNIETLLDYATVDNGQHPTMGNNCYRLMFNECSSLIQAPTLPAIELTEWCYANMFKDCTSLLQAPKLPATTLADYCYNMMFLRCISLTIAPELPVTTLADHCYQNMFNGCTSLTQAPTLPATELTEWCYDGMFYDCTSLTTPPELPATTLAERCYFDMFRNCTSLTEAPELPATILAESCYSYMFWKCTSLTEAPELPATTLAKWCYAHMFDFCTSLEILPVLPVIELTEWCYSGMFNGCTNIKLSETQTGEYQYEYRIPISGTGTVGMYSLDNMFTDTGGTFTGTPNINTIYYTNHKTKVLTALKFSSDDNFTLSVNTPHWNGTIEYSINKGNSWSTWDGSQISGTSDQPIYLRGTGNNIIAGGTTYNWNFTGKYIEGNIEALLDYQTVENGQHPVMNSYCYQSMFYNCTTLKLPPSLPAITLSNGCYNGMFQGCTSLIKIPQLPATTLINVCYMNMFNGCSNIKLSTTLTGNYQYEYRIPITGTGASASLALYNMFANTGGTFKGEPSINTIYYTNNEPV